MPKKKSKRKPGGQNRNKQAKSVIAQAETTNGKTEEAATVEVPIEAPKIESQLEVSAPSVKVDADSRPSQNVSTDSSAGLSSEVSSALSGGLTSGHSVAASAEANVDASTDVKGETSASADLGSFNADVGGKTFEIKMSF